jgi:hypothetical protein
MVQDSQVPGIQHPQWIGGGTSFQSCSSDDLHHADVDLDFLSTMSYSSSVNPSAAIEYMGNENSYVNGMDHLSYSHDLNSL